MPSTHTLVTFLGKGRDDPGTGYREATYRFPDGTERRTPFFGLSLAEHLGPARLVILGTAGSQWGVLVEHLAAVGEEDDARLELLEAESRGAVTGALLGRLGGLLERALGREVLARVIPFGRTPEEQGTILQAVAESVPSGEVSFDLTHGFRHLGMVGFLSAFMLERAGRLRVRGLWYGALDMTADGVAPVLRLDGLGAVQKWVDALDRFDASGDYGVFAELLMADGVPEDKARCLGEAAFFERTFNLSDAERKLRTFLPALDAPLPGASGLFQARLRERLAWVQEKGLAAHQRQLAYLYLERGDFVRASIFAWEAVISRECEARGLPVVDFKLGREPAADELEAEIQNDEHPSWRRQAYWTLKNLRNALAHGSRPTLPRVRRMLKEPESLERELRDVFDQLLR